MATTISSTVSYTLGANEDNLVLLGTGNINGSGNAGNNQITGNAGANVLNGLGGNDWMDAGGGNDVLYLDGNDWVNGGAGADTFWVTGPNNTIVDSSADSSVDTVKSWVSTTMSAALDNIQPWAFISGGIERIELQGSANLASVGIYGRQTLIGNAGNNILIGGQDADTMLGGDGNDTLYAGNASNTLLDTAYDQLEGGNGNDTLYANGGDYLLGGYGDDVFVLAGGNNFVGDYGGVDTIISDESFGLGRYPNQVGSSWASGDIENLQLSGTLNINGYGDSHNNTLTGNSGNNLLEGGGGVDVLNGGAGNDVLQVNVPQTGAMLTGGIGSDEFRFAATYAGDHTAGTASITITDFAQGQDWINLSRSGLNSLTTLNVQAGDTLASLLAQASNQASAAQPQALSQFVWEGDTYVVLDSSATSGFASTDLAFKLNGAKTLTLADFATSAPVSPLIGGAGNDVLHVTAAPSNGIDYQQGATLTGNGGNDVFWIDAGYRGDHATGSNALIISDFAHGVDTLRLSMASGLSLPGQINTLAVQTGDTLSTLMARATHQTSTYTMPALSQFVWQGDTYLVLDSTADPTWVGSNLAIKLSGAPTLTLADFSFA